MKQAFVLMAVTFLLTGCTNRNFAPVAQLPDEGVLTQEIFVVTNRARNEENEFGAARATKNTYLRTEISIPENRAPGEVPVNYLNPNASRHFTFVGQHEFTDNQAFLTDLRSRLAQRPAKQREVVLFVHGYYNSFSDSAFRVAQIQADLDILGIGVAYSWPSAGQVLGYTHDRESVLFSRDYFEETLRDLARVSNGRVSVVGHSMGSLLIMETLRQIEFSTPGWSAKNISGVSLLAPDIAVPLFLEQLQGIKPLPQPFAIVVSSEDKALKVSRRINGNTNRLGSGVETEQLADYPIRILDTSDLDDVHGNGHFVVVQSQTLMDMIANAQDTGKALSNTALEILSIGSVRVDKAVTYRVDSDAESRDAR